MLAHTICVIAVVWTPAPNVPPHSSSPLDRPITTRAYTQESFEQVPAPGEAYTEAPERYGAQQDQELRVVQKP